MVIDQARRRKVSSYGGLRTTAPYHIRARGSRATWLQPAFRSEAHTSLVGSHSAWEGLLRGIFGKRETLWLIHSVSFLFEPRTVADTMCEAKKFNDRGPTLMHKVHTLRTTTSLVNPDYLICASLAVNPNTAREDDSVQKFHKMFMERITKGKEFKTPYFGQRENAAHLELVSHPDQYQPVDINQDLGLFFYGVDRLDPEQPYYFAPLEVEHGVVSYPSWDSVRELGIRRYVS